MEIGLRGVYHNLRSRVNRILRAFGCYGRRCAVVACDEVAEHLFVCGHVFGVPRYFYVAQFLGSLGLLFGDCAHISGHIHVVFAELQGLWKRECIAGGLGLGRDVVLIPVGGVVGVVFYLCKVAGGEIIKLDQALFAVVDCYCHVVYCRHYIAGSSARLFAQRFHEGLETDCCGHFGLTVAYDIIVDRESVFARCEQKQGGD